MLHKAEESKMIGHAPKIKMMKEHGRHLRLDDDSCVTESGYDTFCVTAKNHNLGKSLIAWQMREHLISWPSNRP